MAAVRAEYSGAAAPVGLPPPAAAVAGPSPAARAATAAVAAAADRPRAQDRLSGLLQHMAAVQGAQDPVAQGRLNLGLPQLPSRKEPLPDKPARALTAVPDPANDPSVFELGTVHLPVKVSSSGLLAAWSCTSCCWNLMGLAQVLLCCVAASGFLLLTPGLPHTQP